MSENITLEFATKGARKVARAFDRIEDNADGLRRTAGRVGRALRGVGTAAGIGLGAAATATTVFGKAVLDASSEVEQARIKFDSLFGSAEEGAEALGAVRDVAGQVPATFQELLRSAQGIASVVDTSEELQTRLMQLVELSARFPISLREATSNFIRFWRAGAGAADLFREAGINAALGVQAGMETTVEESQTLWRQFFDRIERQGTGATERLANSFKGIMSMISDLWFEFKTQVGQAGLFDAAKRALEEFRQAFQQFIDRGGAQRVARVFHRSVRTMVAAIQGLVNAVVDAQNVLRDSQIARWLGISRPADARLAEADENLEQLKTLRRALGTTVSEGGRPVSDLLPQVQAATGLDIPKGITRGGLTDLVISEIQRLQQEIDGPGGLTDQFSDATTLLEDFNRMMDRFQSGLEGGTQAAEGAAGGGGGASGLMAFARRMGLFPSSGAIPVGGALMPGGVTMPGGIGLPASQAAQVTGPMMNAFSRLRREARSVARAIQKTGLSLEELEDAGLKKLRKFAKRTGQTLEEAFDSLTGSADDGSQQMKNAASTTIAAFGAMAQAAIRGSDQMATSFIQGITQIIRSIPGVGPVAGAIVGAAGGILSAAFSGGGSDNRPQPVEVTNDSVPVEEQNPRGLEEVVLQFIDSADAEKLQYDLNRRTRRDATERIPQGTSLGG